MPRRTHDLERQVDLTRASVGQLIKRVRGMVAEIATLRSLVVEKDRLLDSARRELLERYQDQRLEAESRGWGYLFKSEKSATELR